MVKLKVQAAVVVVVVFLLGIVTGVGVTRYYAARALAEIAEGPPELAQGRMISHVMARKLRLSHEQRKTVREIFDRHAKDFVEIRTKNEPDVARVREQIRKEVMTVLDESQGAEFLRLEGEMAQRRERMGIPRAPRSKI